MSKNPTFFCSECGENFFKWQGQCSNCKEWNVLKEWKETKLSTSKNSKNITGKNLVNEGKKEAKQDHDMKRVSTNIEEVDRVLGGGFFPGSFILFGGSPGVGKSTLALQMFINIEEALYFSGEESVEQVSHRGEKSNIRLRY